MELTVDGRPGIIYRTLSRVSSGTQLWQVDRVERLVCQERLTAKPASPLGVIGQLE